MKFVLVTNLVRHVLVREGSAETTQEDNLVSLKKQGFRPVGAPIEANSWLEAKAQCEDRVELLNYGM